MASFRVGLFESDPVFTQNMHFVLIGVKYKHTYLFIEEFYVRKISLLCSITFVSLLVGCTHIVSSNERSVVIESQSMNISEAQMLADKECARRNRIAVVTVKADYWDRNYVFNCVLNDVQPIQVSNEDSSSKTTPQKLRELNSLKNEGLISDEEYQQKRKLLMEHL